MADAVAVAVGVTAEDYDDAHAAHPSPLMIDLWAEAFGDQYPVEVQPFSSCSWWVLAQTVASLRLAPDSLLVDLGCGRGGPGLWLARAMSARLVAIDFSTVAVTAARQRVPDFLAPDRADIRQATFQDTGLDDGCAAGVVSIDALPFAPDRLEALREIRRILAPTGRAVITAVERPAGPGSWHSLAADAGLEIEQTLVNPDYEKHWRRLYALWESHESDLRREIGDEATDDRLYEAAKVGPRLGQKRALLMVMRPAEDIFPAIPYL